MEAAVWGQGCGGRGVGAEVWGLGCGGSGVGAAVCGPGCRARAVGAGVWGQECTGRSVGTGLWARGVEVTLSHLGPLPARDNAWGESSSQHGNVLHTTHNPTPSQLNAMLQHSLESWLPYVVLEQCTGVPTPSTLCHSHLVPEPSSTSSFFTMPL